MRALDSNGTLWAWPRVQANASAISTESTSTSTSRSQYKTSVYEESSIKLTKNASILLSSKKIKCLAPWASHVRTAASHVTCRKHYTGIYRVRYSLPLLIIYSCSRIIHIMSLHVVQHSLRITTPTNIWVCDVRHASLVPRSSQTPPSRRDKGLVNFG